MKQKLLYLKDWDIKKNHKYMTSISKLDDTVNKYNNAYHRTSKMKPLM